MPPPPQPPSFENSAHSSEYNRQEYDDAPEYSSPAFPNNVDHPTFGERGGDFPRFPHPDSSHMPPGLPHLPPLPPLPQGLPLPDGLQIPPNMPQFVPPPLPPVMLNPVHVPSAPVIKPPTVPLDNYDPLEAVEDRTGETGTTGADGQRGEKKRGEKRKFVRVGGGQTWEDDTLSDWDPSKSFVLLVLGIWLS